MILEEERRDSEAAQDEEGVQRHCGSGDDQEQRNRKDHLEVHNEFDEHGDASQTVESTDLPEAA
jgi:hypothetical protein